MFKEEGEDKNIIQNKQSEKSGDIAERSVPVEEDSKKVSREEIEEKIKTRIEKGKEALNILESSPVIQVFKNFQEDFQNFTGPYTRMALMENPDIKVYRSLLDDIKNDEKRLAEKKNEDK